MVSLGFLMDQALLPEPNLHWLYGDTNNSLCDTLLCQDMKLSWPCLGQLNTVSLQAAPCPHDMSSQHVHRASVSLHVLMTKGQNEKGLRSLSINSTTCFARLQE